jgi:CRP/FNR family cyclic AMP-dependent transcriptional regulator
MTGTQEPVKMLARVDIFSGMSERHLKKLASMVRETTHPAGREVASEGQGGLAFHLITSGTADVTMRGEGVRRLGPGDYFGEISMIDGKPRSATVTAVEELRTVAVPHIVFEDLVSSEPEFAHGLLKVLCARIREIEGR